MAVVSERALGRWENEGGGLARELRDQFPGVRDWHYLDTAASAQKPQAVIDAVARAMGEDYATVHRGVYARSANMTLAFEAARRRVAEFVGGKEDEIVFVRGATEAINLVAQCSRLSQWGQSPKGQSQPRILLSQLEHHSNIVPWQLAGYEIDVCPLTADGCIDLDAAEAMLTPEHVLVAFAHVSNVLGSVLDVRRAAELAHKVGAKLLVDGCQAVPRLPVDVADLDCDFYVFSGHKLYGPTGIGALWGRKELLDAMPPWQGGGSMIDRVTFAKTTYAPAPTRFEAGTPAIAEVIGLRAAIDYVDAIGLDAIHAHECELVRQTREALRSINSITLHGPEDAAGIVSFSMEGVHPHDIGTILDEEGVAIRAGHHCAQPLMEHLGVPATARASFGIYNDESDVAALVRGLERVKRIFG
ncbi:MAG: cysteine desulfurase [Sphingomonadales bacterium]|jgi:cysteine desulfurase/selenocysteine lyase|nr:cysteine desulfurase [Sphingomonadales bacterium]MBK9002603.1 cysteine desulfurase [Sphingomonadales bacterium]MBK9267824.1 cysteine desulfurase [Sphingomonadales bacterium]MBP6433277.1 cysteine desulfurase [Sphingorhabdus sp.]